MSLNEGLVQELHKQVIKKIKRRRRMRRIWAADLTGMDHYLLRTEVLNIYCM